MAKAWDTLLLDGYARCPQESSGIRGFQLAGPVSVYMYCSFLGQMLHVYVFRRRREPLHLIVNCDCKFLLVWFDTTAPAEGSIHGVQAQELTVELTFETTAGTEVETTVGSQDETYSWKCSWNYSWKSG